MKVIGDQRVISMENTQHTALFSAETRDPQQDEEQENQASAD